MIVSIKYLEKPRKVNWTQKGCNGKEPTEIVYSWVVSPPTIEIKEIEAEHNIKWSDVSDMYINYGVLHLTLNDGNEVEHIISDDCPSNYCDFDHPDVLEVS